MDALPLLVPGVSNVLSGSAWETWGTGTREPSHGDGIGQRGGFNTGDAVAWGLVGFFLITLGVVAGCMGISLTRPRGRSPEHQLIEEVLENEEKLANRSPSGETAGAPWEKPADWWKDGARPDGRE